MPVPTCATNVWLSTNTTWEYTVGVGGLALPRIKSWDHEAKSVNDTIYSIPCYLELMSQFSVPLPSPFITSGLTCSASWSNWGTRRRYKNVSLWLCVPLKHLFIESLFFGPIFNVVLSHCAEISLSRLATVALTACGRWQTQLSGKQPFTVTSLQSALPTKQVFRGNSVKELTIW